MGTHLKKFATHAEYEAFVNSGITYWPNVSVCEDRTEAHYNNNGTIVNPSGDTPTPSGDTHPFVEIAGIKWATMNVGATAETDFGLYFAWAETDGYTIDDVDQHERDFDNTEYKYFEYPDVTKYNGNDEKMRLESGDDAVIAAWGNDWRTPTYEELQSLLNATTCVWTTDYKSTGVKGVIVTDKTDNTKQLFFPAAGILYNVYYTGSVGKYAAVWSSDRSDYQENAHYLHLGDDKTEVETEKRWFGMPLRGVKIN